ncbi:hypothetical protein CK203_042763 [Vitis vinifera]|uniref:Uncharacterized protein n=1 Tax=Vitis vinifera TaxID=29760 RepID=A0A438HQN5_VITVI|nr:hypothetical protein CK203_042763 [Vitis vinifera]
MVFTDHFALKYLLTKQDAKARMIRWILLLQEFNLHIKDKKGVENVVADHISRLAIAHNSHALPINDDFLEGSLMLVEVVPWYAHVANYLSQEKFQVSGKHKIRSTSLQKFMPTIGKSHFYSSIVWIRYKKCAPEEEQQGILSHYHENACGGHFAYQKTAMRVLQSGFCWPSLFKDAHTMCKSCDRCQRLGKLTRRNMMPLNPF